MTVNWLSSPPEVFLTVRGAEPMSPKQVRLLEDLVAQEMGQPFTLHFLVSQLDHVTREEELKDLWLGN